MPSTGRRRLVVALSMAVGLVAGVGAAAGNAAAGDVPQYEGVTPCRKCHRMTKREKYYDDAFEIWQKSPHASALEVLKNDQSKAIAAKMGIADAATDPECLRCHVTAYGAEATALGRTYDPAEAVTCESCHGPGSEYKKKEVHAERYEDALAVGFRALATKEEVLETCASCHNAESPTWKPGYLDDWHEWQHPGTEGRDGVEGPAKKDRGDWVPHAKGAK